jgi:hypothetical protein
MRLRLGVLWMVLGLGLTACSMKQKYTGIVFPYAGEGRGERVAVAVIDRREVVLSGKKPSNWVGSVRNLYGRPFPCYTDNKKPLADAFADNIAATLKKAGYKVKVVPTDEGEKAAEVLARLKEAGADRLVMVNMNNWQSDFYMGGFMDFDLSLSVGDGQGKLLAKNAIQGRKPARTSFASGKFDPRPVIKEKLGELFDDSKVIKALE